MFGETKDKSDAIAVDEEEVRSINEAAAFATEHIAKFHERHGTEMGMSKEQMRKHQQLLILNKQDRYEANLVDDKGRVQRRLALDFEYKGGNSERRWP